MACPLRSGLNAVRTPDRRPPLQTPPSLPIPNSRTLIWSSFPPPQRSNFTPPLTVAIAAQQLYGNGVKLRPGQTVEYVITDAHNPVPNDRVRAYALWEGWHGYDRRKYRAMLLEAFEPFEQPLLRSGSKEAANATQ